MRRIYIAGKYSAPTVLEGLENIRKGQRAATEILLQGNAVFCPWCDHQLFLQLRDGEEISAEDIKAHSMKWLEVSDLVYVIKGWENSVGTKEEIARAKKLKIPVVYEK